jgi:hypothetical protein
MQHFNPSLIYTPFNNSRYLRYLSLMSLINSSSASVHYLGSKAGIVPPYVFWINYNDRWTKFPKFANNSLLFLSTKSFQEN